MGQLFSLLGIAITLVFVAVVGFLVWYFWDFFVWLYNTITGGDSDDGKPLTNRTDCKHTYEEMTTCDGNPPDCTADFDKAVGDFINYRDRVLAGEILDEKEIGIFCQGLHIQNYRAFYGCVCSCEKCNDAYCTTPENEIVDTCIDDLVEVIPDES